VAMLQGKGGRRALESSISWYEVRNRGWVPRVTWQALAVRHRSLDIPQAPTALANGSGACMEGGRKTDAAALVQGTTPLQSRAEHSIEQVIEPSSA
jgi:hypothetical protein